jgi:hypothetical protein
MFDSVCDDGGHKCGGQNLCDHGYVSFYFFDCRCIYATCVRQCFYFVFSKVCVRAVNNEKIRLRDCALVQFIYISVRGTITVRACYVDNNFQDLIDCSVSIMNNRKYIWIG